MKVQGKEAAPLWLGVIGAITAVGGLLVALASLLLTVIPPTSATVPNVYENELELGVARLAAAGFTDVTIVTNCSGSVEEGLIREVILSTNADVDDETTLVGSQGASPIDVPFDAPLVVKESDGTDC